MFKQLSLRRILTTRVFLVATAYLLCMVAVVTLWLTPRLQNVVERNNESLAQALAVQVEKYIETPQRTLKAVADRIGTGHRHQYGGLSSLLDTLVASSEVFEAIYVLDERGHIAAIGLPNAVRNRQDFLDLDLSGNPFLLDVRRSAEERVVWSGVYLSAVTGRLAVAVAMRVDGQLAVGEVGIATLSDFVRRVAAREATTMLIVDGRGQILAHPDVKVASQQFNIGNLPLLGPQNAQGLVTSIVVFDNREQIATRAPILGVDWRVVVTHPLSMAREPIITTVAVLALVGIFITAIILWLGDAFARSFSGVFARLVGTAEAVALGRYPTRWARSRVIEFGRLMESLQRMSQAVQDRETALARSQRELQNLNRTLESRVDERTAQLAAANAELHSLIERLQQVQDNLQRADRLAALGALVAGVAHELNTPIGNCLVVASACEQRQKEFVTLLEKGVTRTSLEAMIEDNRIAMDLLQSNLRRAGELISSFKQVAVDQTTARRRQFRLDESVAEILASISPSISIGGCRVVSKVPPGIELDSFPGPLGQVISNLVSNAVFHGYEGHGTDMLGEVRVEACLLENDWVELTVADDGKGISQDNLKRIFDPFFTTRMGRGGTGLGLNIVHNIVTDLLGGTIRVDSGIGRGTRFVITIPRLAPLTGAQL